MITKIREKMILLKGKKIAFRYNGSRNQIDVFEGKIVDCYNCVFTVLVDGLIRSFTYSDVLVGSLEVDI